MPSAGMPSAGMPPVGMPLAGMPSAGMPPAGMPSAGMPSAGMLLVAAPWPAPAVPADLEKPLTVAVRGTHSSLPRMDAGHDEWSSNALAHNRIEIVVQKMSRDGFGC